MINVLADACVYLDLRNTTRNRPHRVMQFSSRNNSLQFHGDFAHYLLNSVIELPAAFYRRCRVSSALRFLRNYRKEK